MKALSLDAPRIRFNSGFHDGASDRLRGYPNRMYITGKPGQLGRSNPLPKGDGFKHYRAGYSYGQQCELNKPHPESSEPAWLEYMAEHAKAREQRKTLRDMRPERSFRC